MAIDREETKNQLFGGFQKCKTPEVPNVGVSVVKEGTPQNKPETPKLPKWKTLEKVTVLLTSEQKDQMDELARKLMRFRHKEGGSFDDKERITANSVVRVILDNVIEKIDTLEIQKILTEDELKTWMSGLFK
jgi:hypothetical protein